MMRRLSDEYAKDRMQKYPNLTAKEHLHYAWRELWLYLVLVVLAYGVVLGLLWVTDTHPQFIFGAGMAYLGFVSSVVWRDLSRIAAFKRLMADD